MVRLRVCHGQRRPALEHRGELHRQRRCPGPGRNRVEHLRRGGQRWVAVVSPTAPTTGRWSSLTSTTRACFFRRQAGVFAGSADTAYSMTTHRWWRLRMMPRPRTCSTRPRMGRRGRSASLRNHPTGNYANDDPWCRSVGWVQPRDHGQRQHPARRWRWWRRRAVVVRAGRLPPSMRGVVMSRAGRRRPNTLIIRRSPWRHCHPRPAAGRSVWQGPNNAIGMERWRGRVVRIQAARPDRASRTPTRPPWWTPWQRWRSPPPTPLPRWTPRRPCRCPGCPRCRHGSDAATFSVAVAASDAAAGNDAAAALSATIATPFRHRHGDQTVSPGDHRHRHRH